MDRISERLIYYIGSEGNLGLERIFIYKYDENNQIEEVQHLSPSNQEIYRTYKYNWLDNNLVFWTAHDIDDELLFEYSYDYDNKLNIWKNIPYYLETPNYLSKNNFIKTVHVDYTGPSSCNPCTNEHTDSYIYNLDDYVVKEIPNPGTPFSATEYIYE